MFSKKLIFVVGILLLLPVFIIITACLMFFNFFGANVTDGYVENNSEYASQYKETVNKAIKDGKGYVPLNRILYFYLEDETLKFEDIYNDNLDKDSNKMLPISDVCNLEKYNFFDVCKDLDTSNQLNEEQSKPFSFPIDLTKINVTSFFMEERIIFGKSNVHGGWDFATSDQTPVKAVCDGKITKVDFPFMMNLTNKTGGGGNQIYLECNVDDEVTYTVIYAHLYPNSAKVSNGQMVKAGDELAGVGTTGYSTGSHLHYEVRLGNKKVDGMSLIDFSSTKK